MLRSSSIGLLRASFALSAVLFLAGSPADAQTLGDISGRVTDSSGVAVGEAPVRLTNSNTNAVRETVSNSTGEYSFPSLAPGTYSIRVEKQGFKSDQVNGVEVQVQQSVRQDFSLVLGQVSDSVIVEANAAQLQAENSTVGAVIENKRIVELPLNGRNFLQLVALAPNVTTLSPPAGQAGSRQGGDRANQSISVAGQRTMFDYFTLDGINNSDPNFNTYVVLPSIDALEEFKVQTGVYPAEFGHNATQINVLSKSGGNTYHGTAFEFLRNEVLDAALYSFTANHAPKNPFKWNQYGFTLGGPVRIPKVFNGKDKLFFTSNYESFRQRQSFQAIYTVPTAAMFNGDFSGITNALYDPNTRVKQPDGTITASPFAGNIIPKSRFDPTSQKLVPYYQQANLQTAKINNNFVRQSAAPPNVSGRSRGSHRQRPICSQCVGSLC
jgi:Carboxypeptidase regulatory-like domain